MADPTKYLRGYSFSNFQANSPNQPLPASNLDVELDNISGKLGEAVDAIKDVRRSDGKIKASALDAESLSTDLVNQIVDDALAEAAASAASAEASATAADVSADAAAASAAAALASETEAEAAAATSVANAALLGVWRDAWTGPGTVYAAGDRVSNAGNSYYAKVGHTSAALFSTDLSALRWGILAEKGASGPGGGDMLSTQNLNDVASKASARANLSVPESSTVLLKASNLSDLANPATGRTNLGLTALGDAIVLQTSATSHAAGTDAQGQGVIPAKTRLAYVNSVAVQSGVTLPSTVSNEGGRDMLVVNHPTSTAGVNVYPAASQGFEGKALNAPILVPPGWRLYLMQRFTTQWAYALLPQSAFTLVDSLLVVLDQKAQGTNGGTFSTGWQTRVLNTVQHNSIPGASLASNRITLPAGTYHISASAPALRVNGHKARLVNITSGLPILDGSAELTEQGGAIVTTRSVIEGVFTLAVASDLEIQHACQTGFSTTGFGQALNFAGSDEVYTMATIRKIG